LPRIALVEMLPRTRRPGRLAPPAFPTADRRQFGRPAGLRTYVMLSTAIEQERLLIAERLLTEIERRHGLPHPRQRELDPVIMDRFLAVYLPEAREGEPVPQTLEYAFSPSLTDALELLRDAVSESPDGRGAAIYVHDLDTGVIPDTLERR
jgi:hypothetical protein